jgi:hypothetical protein
MKLTLGCETPTQAPSEWLDEKEEWFNCPINFISGDCMNFLSKYDAYKNHFATPPDYEKQNAVFNEAVKYFESQVSHFTEMKTGK